MPPFAPVSHPCECLDSHTSAKDFSNLWGIRMAISIRVSASFCLLLLAAFATQSTFAATVSTDCAAIRHRLDQWHLALYRKNTADKNYVASSSFNSLYSDERNFDVAAKYIW
jgi:hypothetical protein